MNLEISLNVDAKSTELQIMEDTRTPIPFCNTNFSLSDFGVDSFAELAEKVGGNLAQSGIDWVLTELGIKVPYLLDVLMKLPVTDCYY